MTQSNVVNLHTSRTSIENKVRDLDYEDLLTNSDPRIREAWGVLIISELVYDFRIRTSHNPSDLVSDSDEYYGHLQPRVDSTQTGDVDYYDEFYVLNKKKTQIPIGFYIDKNLYMMFGWKRARGHLTAVEKGEPSKFDFLEVIFHKDANIYDILDFCSFLARLSNKRIDSVREESSADYSHQIKMQYVLMAKFDKSVESWTEEQKIEWGKKWAKENINPDFAHKSKKGFLSDIVNKAFASHRGQSLAFPSDEEINLNAKRFFPNFDWISDTGNVFKFMCPTRTYRIEEKLNNYWKNDLPPSKARTPAYATLRVGDKLEAVITSAETVKDTITTAIKKLAENNKHAAYIYGGCPLVTKILFVKQMDQGDYRAFQWEEDLNGGEFVEVKEVVNNE